MARGRWRTPLLVLALLPLVLVGWLALAAFSRGEAAVVATDPALQATLARTPPDSGGVTDVAFSPDGRWLATSNEDGVVKLWQVERVDRR